jgi:hypothetical protein
MLAGTSASVPSPLLLVVQTPIVAAVKASYFQTAVCVCLCVVPILLVGCETSMERLWVVSCQESEPHPGHSVVERLPASSMLAPSLTWKGSVWSRLGGVLCRQVMTHCGTLVTQGQEFRGSFGAPAPVLKGPFPPAVLSLGRAHQQGFKSGYRRVQKVVHGWACWLVGPILARAHKTDPSPV